MDLRDLLTPLPKSLLLAIKMSVKSTDPNVVAAEPAVVRAALDHTRMGDVFAAVRLSDEGELVFRMNVVVFKELTKWRRGTWRARPGDYIHDFSVVFFGADDYRVTVSGAEAYALADRALAEGRAGDVAVYTVTSGAPHRALIHRLASLPLRQADQLASA